MYLQPNLFLQDTEAFLADIHKELEAIDLRTGRNTPTQKRHKTEADHNRDRIVDYVEKNNAQMIEKMQTLMDLTKGVLAKMKVQNRDGLNL